MSEFTDNFIAKSSHRRASAVFSTQAQTDLRTAGMPGGRFSSHRLAPKPARKFPRFHFFHRLHDVINLHKKVMVVTYTLHAGLIMMTVRKRLRKGEKS